MVVSRGLLQRDLLMNYLNAEISTASMISMLVGFPYVLRILFGPIVDSKVCCKRKFYLIFCGLLCSLSFFIISLKICKLREVIILLFVYSLGIGMLDVTIESFII